MNLYEYLELRDNFDLYDGDINEFNNLSSEEKIDYLENLNEGWLRDAFGFLTKTLGFLAGGNKNLLGKFLKQSGIRQEQISYLGKQKKRFVRDLLGPEAAENALNDEEDLINYEILDSKKAGTVQKTIRGFLNKKYNLYKELGVDNIEDLDQDQLKNIRQTEDNIVNYIDDTIDKLYNTKTNEVFKKIESKDLKDYQKHGLKYLWEKMIIALKPRILSDLLEHDILESKDVQEAVEYLQRQSSEEVNKGLKELVKKFKGEREEAVAKEFGFEEGQSVRISDGKRIITATVKKIGDKRITIEDKNGNEHDLSKADFKEGVRIAKKTKAKEKGEGEGTEEQQNEPKEGETWKYTDRQGKEHTVTVQNVVRGMVTVEGEDMKEPDMISVKSFMKNAKRISKGKRGGRRGRRGEYEEGIET